MDSVEIDGPVGVEDALARVMLEQPAAAVIDVHGQTDLPERLVHARTFPPLVPFEDRVAVRHERDLVVDVCSMNEVNAPSLLKNT
jgi:hypothetical protein